MNGASGSLNVAVMAPTGRDASLAVQLLLGAGLDSTPVATIVALAECLQQERAGVVLIADEALVEADLRALAQWVAAQPSWSDLPFVVLTRQGGAHERHAAAERLTAVLGNVSFLERPFHPTTLVSLLRSALRARRRQYEARDRLTTVHEAQQGLALALAAGRLGAWELSWPDLVLRASDHAKAHFGRLAGESFDHADLLAALHLQDRTAFKVACEAAGAGSDGLQGSFRVFWPDGSLHWIEMTGRAQRGSSGRVTSLVGVSADITGRRLAEAERERLVAELSEQRGVLEQRVRERTADLLDANAALTAEMAAKAHAEQQLRQAQKIETIGQLVGGVAHDFNNVLMVVLSNLELLRRRLAADPSNLRLVETAKRGATRGAELTKRLLAFARRQDLQPESVKADELVAGMMELIERSVGPFVSVSLTSTPELPRVRVDPNQLEMALLNLAVNARDAMASGGHLSIALRAVHAAADNSSGVLPGAYVAIAVRDSGCGMDAATLAQAIEPFFSTKGVGKGTGLGLSMVHGLARQSGGAFLLSSVPGEGTTAELWLPVSGLPASARQRLPVAEPVDGSGHILLVDDDELVAAGTTAMLEDLGYTVTEAHSGREALDAIAAGLRPRMMVTDHAMPAMTGAELVGEVRQLLPELPVLLVTGYADLLRDEEFVVPKLTKPYTQAQLAAEVSRLMAALTAG